MKGLLANAALVPVVLVAWPLHACAQSVSLDFLTKPMLIECEPGSGETCFRMKFDFVDESAKPIKLQLPSSDQLPSHIDVQVDGEAVKPFYAASLDTSSAVAQPQITLILFDVSGSMLRTDLEGQSRFDAAKDAAAEYLKGLSDVRDLVAIVPFASRDVEKTIANAHFVNTRAAAQSELDALPRPEAHNNTALYSAVRAAVDTLQRQPHVKEALVRLILLTDGTNDVQPQNGDDKGLLSGEAGLAVAASAVQQSGVDVLPIGIGNRQSIDEFAMTRLGTRPPLITTNVDALHKAFQPERPPQGGSMVVTLQAPRSFGSRALLAGRVVHFRARMDLLDGSTLVEDRQALWVAPPVATPAFEGEAGEAEQRAFLKSSHVEPGTWLLFVRPLLTFAGFASVLALLWSGLPRLIWPERYDSRSARPLRPEYWPGQDAAAQRDHQPVIRQAPPGFEPAGRGARAAVRSPAERTIVQAMPGFDPGKTRVS